MSTPPPANSYQPVTPMNPSDERLWATLIHVGGILFEFVPALIGYLVLKDRGPFIRAHAATALNFQITLAIAYVVSGVLTLALVGFLLLPAVWVLSVVFSIIAALAANKGEYYTYPLTIKFVS
ncbi:MULTISPECIES: DUF4870 domain-containing protein [Cryobacterium]|nr:MULTISPECIES: DUF4870 domain-containing protein [Cryobacterium]MDY7527597.1 DUF4870 domain-containing protein [Cryobacterium sp. 10C2]MEB0002792.1 DUF4870 domain-containing protein [Cryobacterium sp. RTC2.1]MEB0200580.1 DUF4870 domain-containing protein [Cryobacterium sp. 5I3]MEB0286926.1 DUF4870 domain-containing protein [Cryobacterium sp. 10S3]MEB0288904.1 DUF4870 domain-containing protein [Cryobacterium sp. 10C2]